MATETESTKFTRVARRISVPLLSIIISFLIIIVILLLMNLDPLLALRSMLVDIFFDQNNDIDITALANVFFYATPLILTGLSVAIAFRAGMFNIGTEGQVVIGGFFTAFLGSAVRIAGFDIPPIILMPVLIIVGILGGSLWALVPAILKTKGVHEVITTIMMNYIANILMVFLIGAADSPFSDKNLAGNSSPQTAPIPTNARIPTIFGRGVSPLHWGLLISVLTCILIYIVLWRTKLGYETRAVGHNPSAAKYGGINVNRNLIYVMLISGGVAGLAGSLVVMGPLFGFFLYGSTAGIGFEGIAIAIIGENHPIGVMFGAVLFGWLQASSTKLQQNGIPKDIANTMKGFIVLIVAVPLFSKMIMAYVGKTDWYNKSVNSYNRRINSNPTMTNKFIHIILLIFIWTALFNLFLSIIDNIIPTFKQIVLFLLQRIYSIFSLLVLGLLFLLYLDISGLVYFGEQGLAAILKEIPLIGDVAITLSTLSDDLYTQDPRQYVAMVSTLLSAGVVILALSSKRLGISKGVQRILWIFSAIFIVFMFFSLVREFGQDIILLIVFGIVTFFIAFQEFRVRSPSKATDTTPEPITQDLDIDLETTTRKFISIILFYVLLTFVVVIAESISLPFTIPLFFLEISDLGALIGFIGIVSIPVTYIYLQRIKLPSDVGVRIKSLPLFFVISALVFGFVSLSWIFSMNPFLLFTQTLSIAAPIGFAALGGMYSEKSGVVNIGLEGMMLSGAFVAVWFSHVTRDPWLGVLGAVIAGAVMGLLHAVASIRFRADQVVVGVAINILASAITMLGLLIVYGPQNVGTSPIVPGLKNIKFLFLEDIPFIGEILYKLSGGFSGLSPLVYVFIFLIFVSYWIIEHTSFGLRVRAVGEHPRAADTLGINVFQLRYICVILSGIFAALGGAQLTLGWTPLFNRDMTTGRGFVALAALIFGGWSPIGAGLASLFFGFAIAFRRQIEALGISWAISILGFVWRLDKLIKMLPYLLTIIAVSTVARRMRPPAADGIPYEKEG
ncbi:MAG: ABC transporter permease subunit [Candidatus Hodarchaeales archaeon]